MIDRDIDHDLQEYLVNFLPNVGLDTDTYLPYVAGYIESNIDDSEDEASDLDGLMELLSASSESHSDDEATWSLLRAEIFRRREELKIVGEQEKVSRILI
mmetsp:Transcript_11045/g.15538  ORF Transcript_11045/g.15538 Transcript_11045/m.15538 type:complete len:100 (+) Transcript_11045:36-335(+)